MVVTEFLMDLEIALENVGILYSWQGGSGFSWCNSTENVYQQAKRFNVLASLQNAANVMDAMIRAKSNQEHIPQSYWLRYG